MYWLISIFSERVKHNSLLATARRELFTLSLQMTIN